MVNFGLNSASILGIFLVIAGAGLYFMRSVRPELSRDHDIFFAAVGLLCGFILLFQGWRLDPILQFGQFLLTGVAVFFAAETIRLRGVTTEQARRNAPPIVDEERPVSRVYRAELDQIEPYDDQREDRGYEERRLRGYAEPRPSRSRNRPERYSNSEPPRKRRRSPNTPLDGDRYQDYQDYDAWGEPPERPVSNSPNRSRPSYSNSERPERNSKRRPRPQDLGVSYSDSDVIPTDYHPVDESDQERGERMSERGSESQNRGDSQINFDY
jgi:hypothetical protein